MNCPEVWVKQIYRSHFIRVGRSRIEGTGVFAKRRIHRGARIIEYTGNLGQTIKLSGKVRILGIDEGGKLIMSNTRGEKFYLDAATGDMIFAK